MTSRNLFAGAFASVFTLKRRTQAVLVALAVFATSQATASTITYAVSIFGVNAVGNTLGIGGSITTDGTLGPLSASNIIDWDLIGATKNTGGQASIFNLVGPLSGGPNSRVQILTVNIIATPSTLAFDPSSDRGALSFIKDPPEVITPLINFEFINPNALDFFAQGPTAVDLFVANPSTYVFADGKVLPTPLPAALPLFATGLGALGLLGWRRKKKAARLIKHQI